MKKAASSAAVSKQLRALLPSRSGLCVHPIFSHRILKTCTKRPLFSKIIFTTSGTFLNEIGKFICLFLLGTSVSEEGRIWFVAMALNHAKTPTVLPTIAFASVQMSRVKRANNVIP